MTSGTRNLVEEHLQLSQAWINAEQARVDILQRILNDHAAKCTMDYPDGLFAAYEDALSRASQTSRVYTQWLAEQGIQAR